MITDRERKWADRIHFVAAALLMVLALGRVDGWPSAVAAIGLYLAVCASEAWIDAGARLYILADGNES